MIKSGLLTTAFYDVYQLMCLFIDSEWKYFSTVVVYILLIFFIFNHFTFLEENR